jgi:DNA-binding response OmpR family regulator
MANYEILIIDDDTVITQIAQRILEKKGYAVRVAADARKGLALALTYPPDLIVLDYMMPQKDGLTLLADIRALPELKEVPVIMMTGVSEQDIVAKAIQLGVTDFMAKPFYPPRLLERVMKHLPVPPTSGQPKPESDEPPAEPELPPLPPPPSDPATS